MDSDEAQKRMAEKLKLCHGTDPAKLKTDAAWIPLNITFTEIYQFMVKDPDPFTGLPRNSTKGMEAALYFKNGWVKNLTGRRLQDVFVVHGAVHHSFALNEPPLLPWIIIRVDGKILAAHCTCAIGLLECCSHVGATLFALDGIRADILDKKLSVTDLECYWKKPPTITKDLYKKIRELDFGKKVKKTYPAIVPIPDNDNRHLELMKAMQRDGISCAVMSMFCDEINNGFCCDSCSTEKELQEKFESFDLSLLFNSKYRLKSKEELLNLSIQIYNNMDNNPQIIKDIEIITCLQNGSKWWMKLRLGRITASNLKAVLSTNHSKPSVSLIKQICYPFSTPLLTPAIQYGREHEEEAVIKLYELVASSHQNLVIQKAGLHISPEHPCLGASPDAIFHCSCHGTITVEVKCPYSAKDAANMREILLKQQDPFIVVDKSGNTIMNINHKYFYQAFMQVHICNAAYGYFFTWSVHDKIVFQVKRDDKFWNYCRETAVSFFRNIIVPELLAKVHTDKIQC